MTLKTIAIKNIMRRKGKMILIVLGLALAVATLVSVVTIMQAFRGTVDRQLDEYGFNIIISPKSKEVVIEYGDIVVGSVSSYQAPSLGQVELDKVKTVAEKSRRVRGISPKLLDTAEVKGKRVLLAGVDMAAERRIKKWWLVEAGRYPTKEDEVFVGEIAAEKLGIQLGDKIKSHGQELRVAGILMETGSQDDNLIFVDIDKLRAMSGKDGQVSLIELAAKRTEDVDSLVGKLNKVLPAAQVQSIKKAVRYKENALDHLTRFGLGVTAIVVLISAFIVFTMMASAVNERRVEIGIFRAVGFRQSKIATIILIEALILGVASGLIGYIIGFSLALLLPAAGFDFQVIIQPNPFLIFLAVALSVSIGLLASLIPAWRAANLDPVESLKGF